MKKCMFVLVLLGIMPVLGANAYEYRSSSSEYTTTRSSDSGNYKKTTKIRRSGGYSNTITNNFYYGQPAQYSNRGQAYRDYNEGVVEESKESVVQTRTVRSSQERKYFLAHPFFQPLKGRFGSVTDLSYAKNSFKVDILNGSVKDLDPASSTYNERSIVYPGNGSGKAEISQFLIKEDLSFGLSDTLALMLMAQYDKTTVQFKDWDNDSSNDEVTHSGLNIFGIGLQNRFVDTDEWIAMFSAFLQHQRKTSNSFVFDVKAGYKVNRTTIYGLGRLAYVNLTNGDIYGAYIDDPSGSWAMFSYKEGVNDVTYGELGAGFFSVLSKYTYLGGELIYGYYDWHNQLNLKGTFGFQPRDSFAVSLYGSVSLYDSAKNKINRYMNYDTHPKFPAEPLILESDPSGSIDTTSKLLYTTGDYRIKNYSEWKIGVQAILYF